MLIDELVVSGIMTMYEDARTVVRRVYGNREVNAGLVTHQGSGLSPLLFAVVMEPMCREFQVSFA